MRNESTLWDTHKKLTYFNKRRLNPQTSVTNWREAVANDTRDLLLEGEILESELDQIRPLAAQAPLEPDAFIRWFENLRQTGPGQNDPLFDWLATEADIDHMKWFIQQEVAGEAGFEDLTALTQVKLPSRPKLEMARNYWDEMGRGNERGMHGPMLARVATELGIESSLEDVVPEALALANILTGLAANRRYTYHSVGALGVIELTAPDRAAKVHRGLKRLGLSAEGQRYYSLHSSIDIRHSIEWNKEVLRPLVEIDSKIAVCLAEGALVRLNAGARCFERYRKEFGLGEHRPLVS